MVALLALLWQPTALAGTATTASAATASTTDAAKPMPTMEERTAAFGAINDLYKAGQKKEAADLLVQLTDDPAQEMFRAEAFARLGVILKELDLPYSALVAYNKALEADPEAVASEVKKAIELGDTVGDPAILGPAFAKNVGLPVDNATRSRMAYLAGKEAAREGNWGVASGILQMVQKDDPAFLDAKALQGVVLSNQSRFQDALAPLLIAESGATSGQRDVRFRDVARLNLARAYFGAENYGKAIEYYVKVPRESAYWPEAQFERAWATFRLTDMNGTLGVLQTHASPFFDQEYFPEGDMLRVYALFMLCKFPEASKGIEAFAAQYNPMLDTLRSWSAKDPNELFTAMRTHQETGNSDIPAFIRRSFIDEQRFTDSVHAVAQAEQELTRLGTVGQSPFVARSTEWVNARKAEIESTEGQRIRASIEGMAAQLTEMLGNLEINKLDIMQLEGHLYEQASVLGAMPEPPRKVARELRLKQGYLYWPWDGEWWADEVGYYRVDTRPDCPESLKAAK